jgi:hypothetical protein
MMEQTTAYIALENFKKQDSLRFCIHEYGFFKE